MKKSILSPFYSIIDESLLYLGKYEICKLPKDDNIKSLILMNEGALFKEMDSFKTEDSILVLEPHPDDFVLSVLGYSLGKYNAIVLNIFSKMDVSSFTWSEYIQINEYDYEKLRMQESEFTIKKMLRQQFVSLKEKSMRITDKNPNDIESNILNNTRKQLKSNPKINTILVPMGIGNHPDHIIVYNTIMSAYGKDKSYKIVLYPEYPYARCRRNYDDRLAEIKENYKLKPILINVESKLDILADSISVYRSQFDDINRIQMLAIIREDCRAIAQEYKQNNETLVYYEVENEN